MGLQYLIPTLFFVFFSVNLNAIDLSRYTTEQLLKTKDKYSRNKDMVAKIQQTLSNRGITATITLAEAPAGQEWALRDKNILLQKKEGGPTTPPPGVGNGQWVFAEPDWLYLEKNSGKIFDNAGTVIGKIGSLEPTSSQNAQAIKAMVPEEGLVRARIEELEEKIKKLERERGETSSIPTTEAPPISPDVDTPPESPEAPPFETPEAPPFEAPEAPPFEGPPGAPPFGVLKKLKKSIDELTEQEKKNSDALFKNTLKQCVILFLKSTSFTNYHERIQAELKQLQKKDTFYNTEALNAFIKELTTIEPSDQITKETYISLLSDACKKCLFYSADNSDCKNEITIIITLMFIAHAEQKPIDSARMYEIISLQKTTGAQEVQSLLSELITHMEDSDSTFQEAIQSLIQTFPKEITGQSYLKHIKDKLKTLLVSQEFDRPVELKEIIDTKIGSFAAELQSLGLVTFNDNKQKLIAECQKLFDVCLFTESVPQFKNNLAWIPSFIVASHRTDLQNRSIAAQNISDHVMLSIFNDDALDVEDWLLALQNLLTNSLFLKPDGLMVSYTSAQTTSVAALKTKKPVLQFLTEPFKYTDTVVKSFIDSVALYLAFDAEFVKKELHYENPTLLKETLKRYSEKIRVLPVEKRVRSLTEQFATETFTGKTVADVTASLRQKKSDNKNLVHAIRLLTKTPYEKDAIIEALKNSEFPTPQLQQIETIFDRYNKELNFLKEFNRLLQEFKKKGQYKGKDLYNFIKNSVYPPDLTTAFESIYREPESLYTAVVKYLTPLGSPTEKNITSENFTKMIEPYGILVEVLESFTKNNNVPLLIAALTALDNARIIEGNIYPDVITKNIAAITQQALYKGKLTQLLKDVSADDFMAFIEKVDQFIAAAGTIATIDDSGTVVRSNQYNELMRKVLNSAGFGLLASIRKIIEALNEGNYQQLYGFTDKSRLTSETYEAIEGKFDSLLKLLQKPLLNLSIDEYRKTYNNLIASPEFLTGVPLSKRQILQESLLRLLEKTARDLDTLKKALEESK